MVNLGLNQAWLGGRAACLFRPLGRGGVSGPPGRDCSDADGGGRDSARGLRDSHEPQRGARMKTEEAKQSHNRVIFIPQFKYPGSKSVLHTLHSIKQSHIH